MRVHPLWTKAAKCKNQLSTYILDQRYGPIDIAILGAMLQAKMNLVSLKKYKDMQAHLPPEAALVRNKGGKKETVQS